MTAEHKGKVVMVAIDSSEDSKRAMQYALDKVLKPEKDFLFVIHARALIPAAFKGTGSDHYAVAPDIWREMQKQSEEDSEKLVKSYVDMAIKKHIICSGLSVEGDPRDVIIEESEFRSVSLLILGSRGLGAVKRALLGSVSGHIVSNSRCPALIVRKQERKLSEGEKRIILCSVDESEASKHALKWTLENIFDSETDKVMLITALPLASWTSNYEPSTLELEEKIEMEATEKKRELLLSLNEEAKKLGIHCDMEILRGDAREAVIWAVETFKPDLLVMGNRGLSPFSRMFMGSVSSYCCHNAGCPILVVKQNAKVEPASKLDDGIPPTQATVSF